jgi:hypothetical protein
MYIGDHDDIEWDRACDGNAPEVHGAAAGTVFARVAQPYIGQL